MRAVTLQVDEVPPGACWPVQGLAPSPERDDTLRAAAAYLGCRTAAEPGWLIAHDFR
ncbi:hypothetical protein ACIG3E_32605 [Streptomyces sp. NPDC053474]|uniref:hypothetical protein n=1 Tax=Streptomyces sp. NPDC053474 TaxID=3365704 RepID=UPI0037CECBBD